MEDARERFELFCRQAIKVRERRILAHEIPAVSYVMTVAAPEYRFEMDVPDEQDFDSLLLHLRPFLMKREPVFFNRIANDLSNRLDDEKLKKACDENRIAWKRAGKGYVRIVVGNTEYAAKDLFEMVAYGDRFHLDWDKRTKFAALPRSVQDHARFNLFSFGLSSAKVVIAQSNLIRYAIDETKIRLD